MKEYHKIEGLYQRDMTGSKCLMEGRFRSETVKFLKDIKWVWTEKIDGTNIRIHWDGHRVEFGGRTDRAQIPVELANYLNATFGTPEAEEMFEQKFGETDVVLFGEGYGRKIQKVGSLYRPDDVSFILFDVSAGDVWLRRDSVEDIARSFNIDIVPIVGTGTIDQAVEYVKHGHMSTLNSNAPMEGIVCRPEHELCDRMGHRIIVKIKERDFANNPPCDKSNI